MRSEKKIFSSKFVSAGSLAFQLTMKRTDQLLLSLFKTAAL
jgi:hypothetical protein